MMKVQIDFQEGFQNDTVVLRLGERELVRKEDISTNYAISMAAQMEVEVPSPLAKLEVSIPTRKLSKIVDVKLQGFLAVSIRDNTILYETSDTPFRYM